MKKVLLTALTISAIILGILFTVYYTDYKCHEKGFNTCI